MSFELAKCEKCGAELWLHSLKGRLVIKEGKIQINDGNHVIDLAGFIDSLGIKQNQQITIYVEKGER